MVTDDYDRALLGAVLGGYPDLASLTRLVSGSDFGHPRDEEIWNACLAVDRDGHQPNVLTVRDKLGSRANGYPGGPLYLAELDAPVVAQAPFYAEKVRDASIRRQIDGLGAKCKQIVTNPDLKPVDLVAKIREWSDAIGDFGAGHLKNIDTALEQVVDMAEHGEQAGIPTPWASLSEIVSGWYPGQLIVIGARPGVGKSIALENIATDVARTHKTRVLFVSLEMTHMEITQRTMAHTARVPLTTLRRGVTDDKDWQKIEAAQPIVASARVTFADRPHQTLDNIRAAAWETKREALRNGEPFGLIVIDYLQLIAARDQRVSRQQQVGEISRGLKRLARELEVPVIAAAQLNRANQNRSNGLPMLSDLREAGDIEQDADVVIFMHEATVEDGDRSLPTGEVMLITAKQRSGPTGTRTLRKAGHYAKLFD